MMDQELDFSQARRGRFHRPDLKLRIPFVLSEQALRAALEEAEEFGVDPEFVVDQILRERAALRKLQEPYPRRPPARMEVHQNVVKYDAQAGDKDGDKDGEG